MSDRRLRGLLLSIACVVAFLLVWSRLRIWVVVPMPWYVLVGLVIGLALAIFLGLDHLINRSRS